MDEQSFNALRLRLGDGFAVQRLRAQVDHVDHRSPAEAFPL